MRLLAREVDRAENGNRHLHKCQCNIFVASPSSKHSMASCRSTFSNSEGIFISGVQR
ncbi:hypothetical protein KC19_VG190700 [Ceratodon purpureus]|uniref:Uncharacterized protein n=1 Tax=Ceratodon purpureus TaxID=3225 RepID=A0A8T0HSQ4_CERPU|nr:hypothetical protein KC19_VG190700 [Ceratodon purpureus]